VSSGCDLFLRFITLQATDSATQDFGACKKQLLASGEIAADLVYSFHAFTH